MMCNITGLKGTNDCPMHRVRVYVRNARSIIKMYISNKLERCKNAWVDSDNVRILDITLPYSVP